MSYPPPAYFCIIWHQFLNKFRNLLWFTITPFTTIYGLILLFWIQDWLNVRLGKCKISVCLRWHHLEILGITEFDSEMLENFSNIDLRLKLNRMHFRLSPEIKFQTKKKIFCYLGSRDNCKRWAFLRTKAHCSVQGLKLWTTEDDEAGSGLQASKLVWAGVVTG